MWTARYLDDQDDNCVDDCENKQAVRYISDDYEHRDIAWLVLLMTLVLMMAIVLVMATINM